MELANLNCVLRLCFEYREQTCFFLSCINIRQSPREVLKPEACGLGFQHLPRDPMKVIALQNYVHALTALKRKIFATFASLLALF